MKAHDGAGVGSKASVARVRVSGRRLEETDKAGALLSATWPHAPKLHGGGILRGTAPGVTSMHPPLTLENHPLCRDVVIALKRCHRDASWWGRSFGACNEQKWALDQCLKKQKLFKARANAEKGREERDRLRRRVEKYGHATVNGEFKEK